MPQVAPEDYMCPITRQIMVDPVSTCDGQTYEREAIEEWLRSHNTSPATGLRLANISLTPNIRLRSIIDDFLRHNPQLYQEGQVYLKKGALKALYEAIIKGRIQDFFDILSRSDRGILEQKTASGYTVFHLACEFMSPEYFRTFMQRYTKEQALFISQPRPRDWNPKVLNSELIEAVKRGDESLLLFMLQLGADINVVDQYGCTPIFLAILENKMPIIALLHKNGVSIDMPRTWSRDLCLCNKSLKAGSYTPLQFAIQVDSTIGVETLLRLGANIEQANTQGARPLHIAAGSGKKPIVWLLLNAGVQVDAKTDSGYTALLLSVIGGYEQIVRLLLERGADPNAESSKGNRVLHEAVITTNSSTAIVKWLLHYGADCSLRNSQGNTPDEMANNSSIKELLLTRLMKQGEANEQQKLLISLRQLQERLNVLWQQVEYLTVRDQEAKTKVEQLMARVTPF